MGKFSVLRYVCLNVDKIYLTKDSVLPLPSADRDAGLRNSANYDGNHGDGGLFISQ